MDYTDIGFRTNEIQEFDSNFDPQKPFMYTFYHLHAHVISIRYSTDRELSRLKENVK